MILMDARIKSGHDSVFGIGTSLGHVIASPRRFRTRAVATSSSLGKSEGAGNAGRSSAPVVLREENTQGFATGSPKTFRHSLRDGFTVSFVVSLVIGLSCHHPRSRCASIVTRLIPASRYQDATTSPSAFTCVRLAQRKRPPLPAPNVRDDRETPLVIGHRMRDVVLLICPTAQLDDLRHINTTGKSGGAREKSVK